MLATCFNHVLVVTGASMKFNAETYSLQRSTDWYMLTACQPYKLEVLMEATKRSSSLGLCLNQLLLSVPQQKARDNRTAQRINKVQLTNDPLKRHPPSQLPLPGPYDPVSMETEAGFKDPLKPKESEQEQEWKLRQVSGLPVPVFRDHPSHKVEAECRVRDRKFSSWYTFRSVDFRCSWSSVSLLPEQNPKAACSQCHVFLLTCSGYKYDHYGPVDFLL